MNLSPVVTTKFPVLTASPERAMLSAHSTGATYPADTAPSAFDRVFLAVLKG